MKSSLVFFSLLTCFCVFAQIPSYYSSINFSQTGLPLKNQLATLITNTHTTPISYSDVWNVLVASDLDPTNSTVVLLAYGYDDSDGSVINDRTRDKNNNGGSNGQWNREHTFAQSLGNPALGTVGPGSDAHNLRSSDVQMNGDRGNKLFATGSGTATTVGANWYPGDEWKGDCARIVMYMYLRYNLQCRPIYVGVGTANAVDANMVNLFLDWNAADPVSQLEKNRNNIIQTWQGNRNPFIDNPYIATKIWGGTPAEDTWGGLGFTKEEASEQFSIYPVPAIGHQFYVHTLSENRINAISIFGIDGKLISEIQLNSVNSNLVHITDVPSGIWLVRIVAENGNTSIKKVIVN